MEKAGREVDETIEKLKHGDEGTLEKAGRKIDEALEEDEEADWSRRARPQRSAQVERSACSRRTRSTSLMVCGFDCVECPERTISSESALGR